MSIPPSPEPVARPLRPEDPPRVGGFWLDARLDAQPAGVVYLAHEGGADQTGREVILVLLSAGAAADRVARDRFSGEIDPLHVDTVVARGGQGQDTGRLARRFRPGDSPVASAPTDAPWAALTADQGPLAVAILERVGLEMLGPIGRPAGPEYALHWSDDRAPGGTAQWPLPWPGRHDRAGWVTLFVSWLLMVLLTVLAILLAILLFRDQPPQSPPPPQPTSASASPQSASPSPESGSPSPSPDSASPTPGSASPTPAPSADVSAGGPGERSRL